MRRIARWADLPERSHALLNAFVGRRLLVKGERDGQVVVEVALESLLSQWDELAEWLRVDASDLRDADAVERAAAAWERSDRHDDWLLDGARLAGAETLSARRGFRGTPRARLREFLLASRRRVNRKAGKRKDRGGSTRSLAASPFTGARGASGCDRRGCGCIAVRQSAGRHNKRALAERKQVAAKLVSQSRAMLGGARDGGDRRAIQQMLAAEALEPGSDPEALMNTLIDTTAVDAASSRSPTNVSNVDVSPDGRQLSLSGDDDGLIRRWDLEIP